MSAAHRSRWIAAQATAVAMVLLAGLVAALTRWSTSSRAAP